jgi:hypothetical protein
MSKKYNIIKHFFKLNSNTKQIICASVFEASDDFDESLFRFVQLFKRLRQDFPLLRMDEVNVVRYEANCNMRGLEFEWIGIVPDDYSELNYHNGLEDFSIDDCDN